MEGSEEKIDLDFDENLTENSGNVVQQDQEVPEEATTANIIGDALTKVGEQVSDVVETVVDAGTEVVSDVVEAVKEDVQEPLVVPVLAPEQAAPLTKTRKIKRPAANKPIVDLTKIAEEPTVVKPKKRLVKTVKRKKGTPVKATTAEEWIELKKSFPHLYDVDEDGNFYAAPLGEDGRRENTNIIRSKTFYSDTTENIIGKFKDRDTSEEAKALDEAYASAKMELRALYKEYLSAKNSPTASLNAFNATLSGIIDANRRVQEAEQKRNAYYGLRVMVENFPERLDKYDLYFNEGTDGDGKVPFEVSLCRRNRFPWSYFYTDVKPIAPALELETDQEQSGGAAVKQEFTPEQLQIIRSKQIAAWRASKMRH